MNELYHYGIKGMKWGIRRYQNKDGTLTAAGKKREREKTKGWSKEAKEARRIKRKSVNQMTNKELQTLNRRMELESNYHRLNPSAAKRGLAYVGAVAAAVGTVNTLMGNTKKLQKTGQKARELGKEFVDAYKKARYS